MKSPDYAVRDSHKLPLSISHITSGFIAVLVGYTSSVAIVFQAATTAGATDAQLASWMWALGIGCGITSILLSLYYRSPILTAWSTPGAALLVTGLAGYSMEQAIGIFMMTSGLITFAGMTGVFQRLMQLIPAHLAAAMLAGILLRFGLNAFAGLQTAPLLVGVMLAAWLMGRLMLPRYSVPIALISGLSCATLQGNLPLDEISLVATSPTLMVPEFTWQGLVGVSIPLFIVSMTSQNIPGLATLRAHGYTPSAGPLVSWTGATGVLFGPLGGFSYNLAAITAALCMNPDVDPVPARRFMAAIWSGFFYIGTGILGATVVALFAAFPGELVAAIAGIALFGTLASSLATALHQESGPEAAIVTFLCTASGMTLMGIGSAFWGLAAGLIVHHSVRRRAGTT